MCVYIGRLGSLISLNSVGGGGQGWPAVQLLRDGVGSGGRPGRGLLRAWVYEIPREREAEERGH